jgi:hypothetical protein
LYAIINVGADKIDLSLLSDFSGVNKPLCFLETISILDFSISFPFLLD